MKSIRNAFGARLQEFANSEGLVVYWENVSKAATDTTAAYLRAFLRTGNRAGLGPSGNTSEITRGFFQVDCVCPAGKGWKQGEDLSEAIIEKFKRATTLLDGALVITSAYPADPILSEGRYVVPVTINYTYFLKIGEGKKYLSVYDSIGVAESVSAVNT